jgi:hypothetical protein
MNKYVRETSAAKSIKALVIMKGKRHVATVQAHYGNSRVLVNVWHNDGTPMQHGTAGGYGYDKFTAALSGLTIDGHTMSDHCGGNVKPAKAPGYFPADYKPRKGYRLANYGEYDAAGNISREHEWRELAESQIGNDDYQAVIALAIALRADANLTRGYSSCYKESGLKYLEALGYRVISAI